ncbi:MAG: CDP-alcohol phosphatidyltransferase family protein [Acidobacteriota bacterium]
MLTIPNILTLARLIAVPVFLLASLRGHYTLAFGLFVGAAATDFLDGMIARRFNQRSRLGAVLDPAADKTIMICGYLFYTLRDGLPMVRIPAWLTFTVFIRDFLIISFAYLMYTRVRVTRFPPSWLGKTSTVIQAATLGTTIAVNAFLPGLLWLAEVLFRITAVATLVSGWDYGRRAERMLDPLPGGT